MASEKIELCDCCGLVHNNPARPVRLRSAPDPLRCLETGNPCGTGTWAVGWCKCVNCQKYITALEAPDPRVPIHCEPSFNQNERQALCQQIPTNDGGATSTAAGKSGGMEVSSVENAKSGGDDPRDAALVREARQVIKADVEIDTLQAKIAALCEALEKARQFADRQCGWDKARDLVREIEAALSSTAPVAEAFARRVKAEALTEPATKLAEWELVESYQGLQDQITALRESLRTSAAKALEDAANECSSGKYGIWLRARAAALAPKPPEG